MAEALRSLRGPENVDLMDGKSGMKRKIKLRGGVRKVSHSRVWASW